MTDVSGTKGVTGEKFMKKEERKQCWNARWFIKGYCKLVGCSLICWLGLLDGPKQQFQLKCFFYFNLKIKPLKLCFETKMTKLGVGHFTSISGHFFTNYISSFHKSEVLTVILKDPTCQNLNWIKSYNINHNCFPFIFTFVRKKPGNIQLINGHFMTIFGHFLATTLTSFKKLRFRPSFWGA